MKKILLGLAAACALTGCFSIMRIPMFDKQYYDDNGVVTNTTYHSCPNYPMCIYPALHLRWHLVAFTWKPAPEGHHWRHYAGIPVALISCIGLPGDFLVDTIALPWDWDASETASCPMCNERGCWNNPVPEDAPVDGVMIHVNGTRVK